MTRLTSVFVKSVWHRLCGVSGCEVLDEVPQFLGRWDSDRVPFWRFGDDKGRPTLSEELQLLSSYEASLARAIELLANRRDSVRSVLNTVRMVAVECAQCSGRGRVSIPGDMIDCEACDGWGMVTR